MADKQELETLTTRIPKKYGNKLRVLAAKKRKSIQALVTKGLELLFEEDKKRKKSESQE